MAGAVVQRGDLNVASNTCTFTTGAVAGRVLILAVHYLSTSAVMTTPAGYTKQSSVTFNGSTLAFYVGTAGGGETSLTLSFSATVDAGARWYEISGVSASVDSVAVPASSTSSAGSLSTSLAPQAASTWAFAVAAANGNASISGWSGLAVDGVDGFSFADDYSDVLSFATGAVAGAQSVSVSYSAGSAGAGLLALTLPLATSSGGSSGSTGTSTGSGTGTGSSSTGLSGSTGTTGTTPSGTMTVTADAGNSPPRIRIQIAGMSGSTVTITRVNADGSSYLLRTANPGSLTGSGWYDYESPWTQAGTYTAVSDTGGTCSTTLPALQEYGAQLGWLLHVGVPGLSVSLGWSGLVSVGDRARDVNQGVHQILGRRDPIVRTDGVRRSPTFDMVVRTSTPDQYDAMLALLEFPTTLLAQLVHPVSQRAMYSYLSVGAVTEHDMVDRWYLNDHVEWTLPCTVTSAPAGLLQSPWTCASLLAGYSTVSQVSVAFRTCTDLLLDTPAA